MLTGYASPDRIRRLGQTRLTSWLRHRKVRDYAEVARRAVTAAQGQATLLPGQDLTATIVAELAGNILALDERLKTLDEQIAQTFQQHPQAAVIQSMPASARSSAPHCSSGPVTYAHFPAPAIWLQPPDWSPSPTTPDAAAATCTAPTDTADRCATSSTSRRKPA